MPGFIPLVDSSIQRGHFAVVAICGRLGQGIQFLMRYGAIDNGFAKGVNFRFVVEHRIVQALLEIVHNVKSLNISHFHVTVKGLEGF